MFTWSAICGGLSLKTSLGALVVLGSVASLCAQRQSPATKALPDPGILKDGVYSNPSIGLRYKVPFGWVDRTAEMQQSDEGQPAADPAKARVLLAIFERPPEATGETVNSMVVIAAESVSSYTGLKTAADYFGPLAEVVTAKGFKVVNEPYEFPIGAKQLAREDFRKDLGKLTMQQATLVMLAKGYIVSFTFLGGSEDEVEELLEGVSFPTAQTPGSPHPLHRSSSPSSPPGK